MTVVEVDPSAAAVGSKDLVGFSTLAVFGLPSHLEVVPPTGQEVCNFALSNFSLEALDVG